MPPELLALADKPLSLIFILFLGSLIGMAIEQLVAKQRRAAWRGRNAARWRSATETPAPDSMSKPLATDQLGHVMRAHFKARQLLNNGERRVMSATERAIAEVAPQWRIMAQVCLGEILWSPDKDAFAAINSKRVDMLIVDSAFNPLHAVEFQGSGHHQGSAAARDAVKKEALRRAGIGYIEVHAGDTPADLRAQIVRLAEATA